MVQNGPPVFKTGALNRSATHPLKAIISRDRAENQAFFSGAYELAISLVLAPAQIVRISHMQAIVLTGNLNLMLALMGTRFLLFHTCVYAARAYVTPSSKSGDCLSLALTGKRHPWQRTILVTMTLFRTGF